MRRAEALAARQAEAAALIARRSLVKGGAWITAARQAAEDRLRAAGLPGRRDEYWRFTRPEAFTAPQVAPAEIAGGTESDHFAALDAATFTFVDGVLEPAGRPEPIAHLEIETLAEAAARDIHWAREVYGRLEARAQTPVARPLAALDTALASEGLVIRVTGRVARPLRLRFLRRDPAADARVHVVIRLDPGARLTVLEEGAGAARLSRVIEAEIGAGAVLDHVSLQGRDAGRRAHTHLFAELAAESALHSFALTVNGALSRNEAVVRLEGEGARVTLAGAAVGDGDFHQDDTVFITHAAPGCQSRQVFKKVLRNGATGVFQGKILVAPEAQKTDGYQISQGLLLDGDSRFLAKPELEIYADDVACSHGSTVGALDEEALFYLMSRGVPRARAQDMLVLAFLAEALDEIRHDEARGRLADLLEGWIARHGG